MKTWFSLSPVGEFQEVVTKAAIGKKKKKETKYIFNYYIELQCMS